MTVSHQPLPPNGQRAVAAVRLLRRLSPSELAQVTVLMPELQAHATATLEREPTDDYWRRILREERGGYQPSLDDPFLDGLTYRGYFALSDAEQDSFWEKIFSE